MPTRSHATQFPICASPSRLHSHRCTLTQMHTHTHAQLCSCSDVLLQLLAHRCTCTLAHSRTRTLAQSSTRTIALSNLCSPTLWLTRLTPRLTLTITRTVTDSLTLSLYWYALIPCIYDGRCIPHAHCYGKPTFLCKSFTKEQKAACSYCWRYLHCFSKANSQVPQTYPKV